MTPLDGLLTSTAEVDVRPVAGLPAVRRRREGRVPVEGTDRTIPSTSLDRVIALPDGGGARVLSFGMVTAPIADELVALVDVIAGSLVPESAAS